MTTRETVPQSGDAHRTLLASQLGEEQITETSPLWRGRAIWFAKAVVPVLTWLHDTHGFTLEANSLRSALQAQWLWRLATRRIAVVANASNGNPIELDVADMPESLITPLRDYLAELPGFDPQKAWNEQGSVAPEQHHAYTLASFGSLNREGPAS